MTGLSEEIGGIGGVDAILKFYKTGGVKKVIAHQNLTKALNNSYTKITFILSGEKAPVPCGKKIKGYIEKKIDK